MLKFKALFFYMVLALLGGAQAMVAQTNRVFLFPSGGNTNVTVLNADLSAAGAVPASSSVVAAVGLPDASKYYVVYNTPAGGTIRVANSSLAPVGTITLPASASSAVVTPDGRRLLVTAGMLRIYNTATDAEVVAGGLAVGAGPTDIIVNNDSTQAFVLSTTSGLVSIINLTNNTVSAQIPITSPLSIALLPTNARLLIFSPNKLDIVNLANNSISGGTAVPVPSGKVFVTPDSSKAVILNTPPLGGLTSSIIVDLSNPATQTIIGIVDFTQIVIADNTTAFGIVSGSSRVHRINLSDGSSTEQSYGQNARTLAVSPNGKTLYIASSISSNVTRVDIASNLVQAPPTTVGVPPAGLSLAFAPPTANAVTMTLVGGDKQSLIFGQPARVPLSVKVTTSDGSPVFNYPVTFASADNRLTITPTQPSRTGSNGIAQAYVTVAAAPVTTLTADPQEGVTSAPLSGDQPVNQLETLTVTASATGTNSVNFTFTLGSGTGVIGISGSGQIARPGISQQFPQPLVVRVTDLDGFPLPDGTPVTFRTQGGTAVAPPFQTVTVSGGDGIAQATVFGGTFSSPFNQFEQGIVVAAVDGRPELGSAQFTLLLSFQVPSGIQVVSGDNQSADVGTILFLRAVVTPPAGFVGVNWVVVSGSASLSFTSTVTDGSGQTTNAVTLGPAPGPVVVQANLSGVAGCTTACSVNFNLVATGGPPNKITIIQGENQTGRAGTTLPLALRVRVTTFGGGSFPLPSSEFPLAVTVAPAGAATVSTPVQNGNGDASTVVTISPNFVGPFTVTFTTGGVQASFNLTSTSTATRIVKLSGDNQTVGAGGTTSNPLIVAVQDNNGTGASGIPVTLTGPSAATFVAESTSGNPLTINTDSNGRVAVQVRVAAGTALGNLTVTATAQVGSPAQAASQTFTVVVAGRTPSFTAAAVVNAGSFVAGLAPGGLATVFGTGLSEISGTELPGGATSYKGVSVSIDGVLVPMFAISNVNGQEQINFQVRTDLGVPATVRVEVNNNGSVFGVSGVQVVRAKPGIFEYTPPGSATKYAVATRFSDGQVVGPNTPISRGDVLTIYLTGMGATTPVQLATGQAAPLTGLTRTLFTPTVGIGGQGMEVLFSGLTPGFIGLNQINVRVAANAPQGTAVQLDIVVEGTASQSSRIAVQ